MAEKQRSALLSWPEGTVVLTVRLLDALTVKKQNKNKKHALSSKRNTTTDETLRVTHTHTQKKKIIKLRLNIYLVCVHWLCAEGSLVCVCWTG